MVKLQFFNSLKVGAAWDPPVLLLGVFLEELKVAPQSHICVPVFVAALLPVIQKSNSGVSHLVTGPNGVCTCSEIGFSLQMEPLPCAET